MMGRLVVGGFCWFAFSLLAVFAGFVGGYSAGSFWMTLVSLLGVGVLCWAFSPIAKVLLKR